MVEVVLGGHGETGVDVGVVGCVLLVTLDVAVAHALLEQDAELSGFAGDWERRAGRLYEEVVTAQLRSRPGLSLRVTNNFPYSLQDVRVTVHFDPYVEAFDLGGSDGSHPPLPARQWSSTTTGQTGPGHPGTPTSLGQVMAADRTDGGVDVTARIDVLGPGDAAASPRDEILIATRPQLDEPGGAQEATGWWSVQAATHTYVGRLHPVLVEELDLTQPVLDAVVDYISR